MIGKTISHYETLDKLGEGGMGAVYRARDTSLDREVALKVLPPEVASDPDRLRRFQREARALAKLDHPNIVTVYSVEEADGIHFITMGLVEGKTLAELIPKGGMTLSSIFEIAVPLADALATAHEKGVIHRDLKPGNIMVSADGRVKVLDFGLAKLRPQVGADDVTALATGSLTREGTILGTVPYMSPEQIEGRGLDSRSDLFSLGAVLYEMATGEPPFRGEASVSLISSILKDSPRPVDELRPDLPHHLSRVVGHCLEKDPERRYQSIKDVRNELDALRKEDESAATRASGEEVRAVELPHRRRWWPAVAGIVLSLAALVGLWPDRTPLPPEEASEVDAVPPMIVVLPFENLGPAEDEYFADGMTEEISSRLAMASGLGVISRTSAMRYKEGRPALGQIAEELGVDYVLEGTVRWAKAPEGSGRVRITPQLIRVADDTRLWQVEPYDRVIQDIFETQSEIARRVIREVGVALLEPEHEALGAKPTGNLEAYQAYLRGRYHAGRATQWTEHLDLQLEMFQRAVELDPGFALAHAGVSKAHSAFVHFGADASAERQALARQAAERALELAPGSPEAHLALATYHYHVERDYLSALAELEIAAKGLPNSSESLLLRGAIRRRQGRWEEAVTDLERAVELSPREAQLLGELGYTYATVRRYEEATEHLDRSIALEPEQTAFYLVKALLYVTWKGATEAARAALEAMPRTGDPLLPGTWFWLEVLERDYQAALDQLASSPDEWFPSVASQSPKSLLLGLVHELMEQQELARTAYESAAALLEAQVQGQPGNPRLHMSLGLAYAGLGRKEEAIREGKRAVALYPVSKDANWGTEFVFNLAAIYATVGEPDAALDQIELLLSTPSWCSAPVLRLDPQWDPLRDHPRFQELLVQYSAG